MRDLKAEKFPLKLTDGPTGESTTIYYRKPTNAERVRYGTSMYVRAKGGKTKLKANNFPDQVSLGKALVTGFEKGLFGADGKLISSDPNDVDFRQDWRDLLESGAPEYLAAACRAAMNMVAAENEGLEIWTEDVEGGDTPLQSSSTPS